MKIPFSLTPVQQSVILSSLRAIWPNAKQVAIQQNAPTDDVLAVWSLSGDRKNNQPFEEITLRIHNPELVLDDSGIPQFNCSKVDFVYENGYIKRSIHTYQNNATLPTSLKTLVDANALHMALQDLRAVAAKIPPRQFAA